MSQERHGLRLVAVLLLGVTVSACSGPAATAAPATQSSAATASASADSAPLVRGLPDFTALVERFGPAVVNVQVTEKRPEQQVQQRGPQGAQPQDPFSEFFRRFGMPNPNGGGGPRGNAPPARGEGSGFIVSSDGYIMTNAHVVRGATEVVVRTVDRREYTAKVIGQDARTDVAVIKIDAKDMPTVKIGDPTRLKPGQNPQRRSLQAIAQHYWPLPLRRRGRIRRRNHQRSR
jgi:serine protease Do